MGEVNGQGIRSYVTAPCLEEIRDVEDSVECEEEMAEDTYTTMECQPLCKQLTEDRGATTTWDEQNKGDRQEKGSEEGERVLMKTDEKGQISATLRNPRRTKKMKTESNEERTHLRKSSRTRNTTSKNV